jgi:glutathione S-transferase
MIDCMKFYGDLSAPTSQMVALCFAEKEHQPEFIHVSLAKGEQKSAESLQRHPFGLTPVVENEEGAIYEARAIIRYLDRVLPGPALTPAGGRAYGLMEQFLGVELSYFSPNIMVHFYAKFLGRQLGAEALAAGRANAGRALDVAEQALAGAPFLAGAEFSLAEIAWMPYLHIVGLTGNEDLISSRPHVRDWWARLAARPSWRSLQTT